MKRLLLFAVAVGVLTAQQNITLVKEVPGGIVIYGQVSDPVPSPAAGGYSSTQSVALTAANASSIYYTTDGATPTCTGTGTLYTGAISVAPPLTIKSIGCNSPNWLPSNVVTSAYTFSCTTPTGTKFTESFGDSATSCGFGGYGTCTSTWALSGSAPAITASPGSPSANTACTNSARINTTGVISNNTFTPITAGTTVDIEIGLYVATPGSVGYPAVIDFTDNSSNRVAAIYFDAEPGTSLATFGGNDSSNTYGNQVTLSSAAWHTLTLHIAGASSTYTVDGGTPRGFTAGNYDITRAWINGLTAADIYIGWMRIN